MGFLTKKLSFSSTIILNTMFAKTIAVLLCASGAHAAQAAKLKMFELVGLKPFFWSSIELGIVGKPKGNLVPIYTGIDPTDGQLKRVTVPIDGIRPDCDWEGSNATPWPSQLPSEPKNNVKALFQAKFQAALRSRNLNPVIPSMKIFFGAKKAWDGCNDDNQFSTNFDAANFKIGEDANGDPVLQYPGWFEGTTAKETPFFYQLEDLPILSHIRRTDYNIPQGWIKRDMKGDYLYQGNQPLLDKK